MQKFWSEKARGITPYTPGEQPQDMAYVKLNTNENPYPPSPKVAEAVSRATEKLRLYPDPTCLVFRAAAAKVNGVDVSQVFAGNGSDEVLAIAYQAFFNPDKAILFPDVTYTFYPVYAGLYGIPYRTVALKDDFTMAAVNYVQPNGGIIFPNPNAPTGIAVSTADIEIILKANSNVVVIVDEAYVDFGTETMVPFIATYPNLLVVRTLSKSHGLAGLRCGYALGQAHLISAMMQILYSFNSYTMDQIALAGGGVALEDTAYFESTKNRIIQTRQQTVAELEKLGFSVLPSGANFVFVTHSKISGEVLYQGLKQKGVLVRHFKLPRIENYLRITIGTDAQMAQLLEKVKDCLTRN